MTAVATREGSTLILLRHGQSLWNQQKTFTGWTDIGLSEQGKLDAIAAGRKLRADGYRVDVCFTSMLQRASETLRLVLEEMGQPSLPIERSWRLNERHYGALQGLSFWEGVRRHGLGAVLRCQRRYNVRPPQLTTSDPCFPGHEPRYQDLTVADLPLGESLQDTGERVLPYWKERIEPPLRAGKCVLVVSHRNTLRALIRHIADLSDKKGLQVKVPTATPLVYELDHALKVIRHRALKRPDIVAASAAS